jgi:hypothetical protein
MRVAPCCRWLQGEPILRSHFVTRAREGASVTRKEQKISTLRAPRGRGDEIGTHMGTYLASRAR